MLVGLIRRQQRVAPKRDNKGLLKTVERLDGCHLEKPNKTNMLIQSV